MCTAATWRDLALAQRTGRPAFPPGPPTAAEAAAPVTLERIFFAVGTDALPPEASDVLARVSTTARATTTAVVSVSGFHDPTGDAAANAELARRRAEAVRHALEAHGVPPEQIRLNKPMETAGGTDLADARRVELRVE